ncbi:DgyrCDS7920 [Dimorphilus gyrociliatus]|uniref:Vacuolar protein sorting-associated protein 54 n=1 Tax=Dimorphilus gyrociliatus TaxID=2664684 RepID=A0A7I8VSP9_9ANNE|nr:DgyrCDS7920 [Dimorphilus gyrociliatus]
MSHKPNIETANNTSWTSCGVCENKSTFFKAPQEFIRHLRNYHSKKEGGSYVCQYSKNGVCGTLPIEGVNDDDYQIHIIKHHLGAMLDPKDISITDVLSKSHTSPTTQSTPSVVEDQRKWTVYNSKVNLPAALNDPRVGRRERDIFSKTWGPGFESTDVAPSPHLPVITAVHFQKYLKKTDNKYKKHLKLKEANMRNDELSDEESPLALLKPNVRPRVDLEGIPPIFLKSNFDLENSETFNSVFPWSQVTSGARLLQEKLTHYLDCVEVQIAKQISAKADAFFHAMSSHDQLQEDMKTTLNKIKSLRTKISDLNSLFAEKPLAIMKYNRIRTNRAVVLDKLKLMATVHQTQPTIQVLLASSDYIGALDLIYTTQEVLSQELRGIYSFRHLGSQLSELAKVIEKMMKQEFVKIASNDLNKPLNESEDIEQEHLIAVLSGMVRVDNYDWITTYADEAEVAIKALLKDIIVKAVSHIDDSDNELGSLADQMRLLDYERWMDLLDVVLEKMLSMLKRIKIISDIMKDVCKTACTNTPRKINVSCELDASINQTETEDVDDKINTMFYTIAECAHDRVGKLVTARAKNGFLEKLQPSELVELWEKVQVWMRSSAKLVESERKTGIALSASMKAQATSYINKVHDEKRTKLSLILDNEHWKQAEVPLQFQLLIDHVISSGTLTREGLPQTKNSVEETKPVLKVANEEYGVVGTVLLLFKIVIEYCELAKVVKAVSSDISIRLLELLNMYNSRTCQLVLGAGAVQLVGLKTISTRHLALNSRCLQFIVFLLPLIRRHFEQLIPEKNNNQLRHFDKVTRDYKNHIEEIDNKLVYIIESMFDAQFSKYEVKAPMPSTHVRQAVSQISKFYQAINSLLPEKHIAQLLLRVHQAFKRHMKNALARLRVSNDGGPQQGLVTTDLAYYSGEIRNLRPLSRVDHNMDSVWPSNS